MKKIMITLALIGIGYCGAEAQTKSSVTEKPCKCASIEKKAKVTNVAHVHHHVGGASKTSDTYQVCVEKGGHYQCCTHHKTVSKVAAK